MQSELDYLEDTIPQQPDEALINILRVNVGAYTQLTIDFAVEELRTRGFEVDQSDLSFEVNAPNGDALNLPRNNGVNGVMSGHTVYRRDFGAIIERELFGVGGWLGYFVLSLVILDPILFFAAVYVSGVGRDAVTGYPTIGLFLTQNVVGIIIKCVGIYAGLQLYWIRSNAVRFTKKFLVISASAITVESLVIYFNPAGTAQTIQKDFSSMIGINIAAWVSCGIWYQYLNQSKRVAATFKSK